MNIAQFSSEPLDGILGFNILKHFAVLVNQFRREITFDYPGKLDGKSLQSLWMERAKQADITVSDNSASVNVRLNGLVDEIMLLDTGAVISAISNRTAKLLHLKPTGPAIDQRSVYGDFETTPAKLSRIEIGEFAVDDPIWCYDLKDDKRIPPRMGPDVFAAYRTLFDFPARKLYFAPPSFFK